MPIDIVASEKDRGKKTNNEDKIINHKKLLLGLTIVSKKTQKTLMDLRVLPNIGSTLQMARQATVYSDRIYIYIYILQI